MNPPKCSDEYYIKFAPATPRAKQINLDGEGLKDVFEIDEFDMLNTRDCFISKLSVSAIDKFKDPGLLSMRLIKQDGNRIV